MLTTASWPPQRLRPETAPLSNDGMELIVPRAAESHCCWRELSTAVELWAYRGGPAKKDDWCQTIV